MLRESKPDGVAAFPGERGTLNCIDQAEKLGIRVMWYGWERPHAAKA